MPLKYKFTELFRGRFPAPQILYQQLEDLQRQIEFGADAKPIVKENVGLTKSALNKAFGKKFDNQIGVVHNEEGSYLVIKKDKDYKFIAFEDI